LTDDGLPGRSNWRRFAVLRALVCPSTIIARPEHYVRYLMWLFGFDRVSDLLLHQS
jgi:hypothetical protein